MKKRYQGSRGLAWLEDLARDMRYGMRTLANAPRYAAVAILTLALGIGATTALFTAVRDVLSRSLPVERPEELIELGCVNPLADPSDAGRCNTSFAGVNMYGADRDVVAGAFAFAPIDDIGLSYRGVSEIAHGMLTSGETYGVLGVVHTSGGCWSVRTTAPERRWSPC